MAKWSGNRSIFRMAEFRNTPEAAQNETLPPKGISKTEPEKKEHPGTQAALDFVEKNFGDLPDEDKKDMKVPESVTFFTANPGAADLFVRVIKHCEAKGIRAQLDKECQDGLPISVSDISKLAEKFEIAQVADAAEKNKSDAEKNKSDELQKVSELIAALPSRRPDLSQKFGERLKDWESGKLSSAEKTALARDILSDLKKSFEDAKANGADTSKAAEDLRFFAIQFRDLGVIDHAEFKKLFEEPVQKSVPGQKTQETQIAATQNFSSA